MKRETLFSGRWFPVAKTLRQKCCKCGLRHTWKMRVRKGQVEMMLVSLVSMLACFGADLTYGGEIKLAWDASPTPGVTNYMLVAHTNATAVTNYSMATVRVNLGTNLTATITDLAVGQWHLFVTAGKGGLVSDPSNVLVVEMPRPPANLRTVTVQYGASLESMTNNLFLKLKAP